MATEVETNSFDRSMSLEKEFYLKKQASVDEIQHRHSIFGYDPLDKAIQNLVKECGEARGGHSHEYTVEEYRQKFKELLKDHLDTMFEMGLAFDYEFGAGNRLGFSILVARYGSEGRMFLEVEETHPHCACYPSILKPTDELIAINDELIVDPSEENFQAIKQKIISAPRPLKLTFIQGENRDEAFQAQEARRKKQQDEELQAATEFLASDPQPFKEETKEEIPQVEQQELIEENALQESSPIFEEPKEAAVLNTVKVEENDEAIPPIPPSIEEESVPLNQATPIDLKEEEMAQQAYVIEKDPSATIRPVVIEDDPIDPTYTGTFFCCQCRC
uniref:PDZ domain-containing protein n=1 Tax=Aureoumbra lagunensis TaxID=44058 RepID=A0A7S3K1N0_9STRA|mmetsp:Transcript_15135/g.22716  ORF Transcript_15135/g.22716 Transcript_15135/m.22716 type:complete len:332 (-) Transcript_15135:1254-2249(-)|eukprot:CAMPEP_0197308944 /NCGR_PEP_ID=MMETSP0891-20130614/7471_1 /TAXON_ID=44058 ORGANISM="Aureoumbra lagunensis, Strain CCMP1510" /NCGR_SAMPLE_ID=MMETSP0891 /ASSEMBLY_ACC=CAM_ASM_000534 /LENGTH=331 /DNA_ID=CAMNT_0042793727 /DNA_START=135 /DNA_END=1130 /DNA_ORIENTATION=-